jgi:hypothetical protein
MAQILLQLPDTMAAKMRLIAVATDKTLSDVIRDLITQKIVLYEWDNGPLDLSGPAPVLKRGIRPKADKPAKSKGRPKRLTRIIDMRGTTKIPDDLIKLSTEKHQALKETAKNRGTKLPDLIHNFTRKDQNGKHTKAIRDKIINGDWPQLEKIDAFLRSNGYNFS